MSLLQYLKPALIGLVFLIAGCEQPVQQQPLLQLSGPTMGSSYNLSLVAPAGGLPADAQQQIDRLPFPGDLDALGRQEDQPEVALGHDPRVRVQGPQRTQGLVQAHAELP